MGHDCGIVRATNFVRRRADLELFRVDRSNRNPSVDLHRLREAILVFARTNSVSINNGAFAYRSVVSIAALPGAPTRNADLIRNSEPESSWTETLGHYGGSTNNSRNGANGRRNANSGFPAVCAQCGKDTVVPFEPRSGRPVYCRDCFAANKRAK